MAQRLRLWEECTAGLVSMTGLWLAVEPLAAAPEAAAGGFGSVQASPTPTLSLRPGRQLGLYTNLTIGEVLSTASMRWEAVLQMTTIVLIAWVGKSVRFQPPFAPLVSTALMAPPPPRPALRDASVPPRGPLIPQCAKPAQGAPYLPTLALPHASVRVAGLRHRAPTFAMPPFQPACPGLTLPRTAPLVLRGAHWPQ